MCIKEIFSFYYLITSVIMLLCNSMSGLLYIHSLTFAGMMNGYPTFVASILAIGGNTAIIGLSSINKNKLFFF